MLRLAVPGAAWHSELVDEPRGRWFAVLGREARHTLARHPLAYLPIHLRGMVATFVDNGTNAVLDFVGWLPASSRAAGARRETGFGRRLTQAIHDRPQVVITWLGLTIVLLARLALAVWGLVACRRLAKPGWGAALVLAGYLWFLSGGPVGRHRFRLPLEPLVCVAAAVALERRSDLSGRAATCSDHSGTSAKECTQAQHAH